MDVGRRYQPQAGCARRKDLFVSSWLVTTSSGIPWPGKRGLRERPNALHKPGPGEVQRTPFASPSSKQGENSSRWRSWGRMSLLGKELRWSVVPVT
jgi:hypothetical protein